MIFFKSEPVFMFIYSRNSSNFLLSGNVLVTQTPKFSCLGFWPFPSPTPIDTACPAHRCLSRPCPLFSPRAATGLKAHHFSPGPFWLPPGRFGQFSVLPQNAASTLPMHMVCPPFPCSACGLLVEARALCSVI